MSIDAITMTVQCERRFELICSSSSPSIYLSSQVAVKALRFSLAGDGDLANKSTEVTVCVTAISNKHGSGSRVDVSSRACNLGDAKA